MLIGGQSTALVISDLHLPYQHRDAFDFLWALHQEYRFDRIWNVGDVFDHHRGSYHESEPDAMSEEQEFKMCKKYAQELQEMFPIMQIAQGNHDIIPQRKLKSVGLPMEMLKNFNQMYGLEETWEYKDRWWFDSDASYPVTVPMILKPNGRWDKNIPKVYGD
jgi:UDP-2,3-diacylglucosamine pyrophosphatase LpxH